MNTYLGQKGYTIPKNELTPEKIKEIKTDLTIRPYTQGAPPSVVLTFPAYRESLSKIYVPHYYKSLEGSLFVPLYLSLFIYNL